VLEQHAKEPLDGTEQGAVQHDRAMTLIVGTDVFEAEALGQLEVGLNRRELPLAADRVAHVDVDLRAVERRVTFADGVLHAKSLEGVA